MDKLAKIVEDFLLACSADTDGIRSAFRTYCDGNILWENVGARVTTGVDAAIGVIEEAKRSRGFSRWSSEILAIAVDGAHVLTERMDRIYDAEGRELQALRVAGGFDIVDGKIAAWRDYPSHPKGEIFFA